MPTIQLTNNTNLSITASLPDAKATLNRYLKDPLSFVSSGLDSIVLEQVEDLKEDAFPVTAVAAAAGQFAVEATALVIQPGASASVGFLAGDDAADFCGSLQWTPDPKIAYFVSFGLQGSLQVGDTAAVSDFSFGISKNTTVTVTSFSVAAGSDTFVGAVQRAMEAFTIPHDLNDLASLPPNASCRIEGAGSLQFTASVSYDFLNDPLATKSIPNLPSIAVTATAGATVEGRATHTSGHAVTIAKLSNGLIHLSVELTRTDDFETSLTVSAGVAATIGGQDALAFLLDRINPDSKDEMKTIQANLPAGQAQQLSGSIKAAMDAALSSSLQASLKTALDDSHSNDRIFLYEIDLTALDAAGTAAVQSALMGDFTAITGSGAAFAGIHVLDSAVTVTSTMRHSLALHLLGIFNWQSTSQFVERSSVDFTKDTHEIVLSDETIKVVGNNLDAEKLRQVVVKGITLTLPASANTPSVATPLNMVFFDRQAATSTSKMRQFVNVLTATNSPTAASAAALLNPNSNNYGTSSLYLGLNLTPQLCLQLYNAAGNLAARTPYDWTAYLGFACAAQATILSGDQDNADRLQLFNAGVPFWQQLRNAGSAPNQTALLTSRGIRQEAIVDVITLIWWSSAMEDYSKALAAGQSLDKPGKEVVTNATRGFDEPWLVLAIWNMLGKPAIQSLFTSSLLKKAAGAGL